MPINFEKDHFSARHNGVDDNAIKEMLAVIQAHSLDQLIEETIPEGIRLTEPLKLPDALGEGGVFGRVQEISFKEQSI